MRQALVGRSRCCVQGYVCRVVCTTSSNERTNMVVALDAAAADRLVQDLLVAYGATRENAAVVADHLVDADRSGLPSHGLIRVPQYVGEIRSGEIDPAAIPTVVEDGPGRAHVDGFRSFGQVACMAAVDYATRRVREHGVVLLTLRDIGHAGRIGAYAEVLGARGLLGLLFCSGPRSGHRVAPFNGREGRLATNPIAFAIPTREQPVVGDFSTAMAPEGRIRHLRNAGQAAPPETLLDADGVESTDPNVLYVDPPGTILPLGGLRVGHRGFALGLLVEAFATLLAGDDSTDPARIGNNLTFIVVEVDQTFAERASNLAAYVLSAAPRPDSEIVLPGSLEQQRRTRETGVVVQAAVWQSIVELAESRGVPLPQVRVATASP